MVGVTSLFGVSYVILMPVFAGEILRAGIGGMGMLMSSAGCGALAAALTLAALGDFKHKGRLLIVSGVIFSAALAVFALSRNYLFSLAIIMLVGYGSVMAVSLINTILQHSVPDHFRGRLMSVYMVTFAGFLPFGNLLAGSLTQVIGAAWTVFGGALLCGAFFVSVNFLYPQVRNL